MQEVSKNSRQSFKKSDNFWGKYPSWKIPTIYNTWMSFPTSPSPSIATRQSYIQRCKCWHSTGRDHLPKNTPSQIISMSITLRVVLTQGSDLGKAICWWSHVTWLWFSLQWLIVDKVQASWDEQIHPSYLKSEHTAPSYLDSTVLLQVVMESPGSSNPTASDYFNGQLTSLAVMEKWKEWYMYVGT